MADFQTGVIPTGFAFSETGSAVDLRNVIVVLPPYNDGAIQWSDVTFSVGSDFGDVRLRLAFLVEGGSWTVETWNVAGGGGRVARALPGTIERISVGRMMRDAIDRVDYVPVSWLLQAATIS